MALNSETLAKKKRPRQGSRFQMEFSFPDDDSKKVFLNRLDSAKRLFKAKMKKRSIDNIDLISCLLDLVDAEQPIDSPSENTEIPANSTRPMLKNSGKT